MQYSEHKARRQADYVVSLAAVGRRLAQQQIEDIDEWAGLGPPLLCVHTRAVVKAEHQRRQDQGRKVVTDHIEYWDQCAKVQRRLRGRQLWATAVVLILILGLSLANRAGLFE